MFHAVVLTRKHLTWQYRGFRYRHRKLFLGWYTACFVAEYLVSH